MPNSTRYSIRSDNSKKWSRTCTSLVFPLGSVGVLAPDAADEVFPHS
jgi:hypothetical protein